MVKVEQSRIMSPEESSGLLDAVRRLRVEARKAQISIQHNPDAHKVAEFLSQVALQRARRMVSRGIGLAVAEDIAANAVVRFFTTGIIKGTFDPDFRKENEEGLPIEIKLQRYISTSVVNGFNDYFRRQRVEAEKVAKLALRVTMYEPVAQSSEALAHLTELVDSFGITVGKNGENIDRFPNTTRKILAAIKQTTQEDAYFYGQEDFRSIGTTQDEIAMRANISPSTFKSHLSRFRTAFAREVLSQPPYSLLPLADLIREYGTPHGFIEYYIIENRQLFPLPFLNTRYMKRSVFEDFLRLKGRGVLVDAYHERVAKQGGH